jgi:hypothetical protein
MTAPARICSFELLLLPDGAVLTSRGGREDAGPDLEHVSSHPSDVLRTLERWLKLHEGAEIQGVVRTADEVVDAWTTHNVSSAMYRAASAFEQAWGLSSSANEPFVDSLLDAGTRDSHVRAVVRDTDHDSGLKIAG